jgi:hypothetical protein
MKYSKFALLFLMPAAAHAAIVTGNLGGLTNPTGAATNSNKDRQYSWTTSGGQVTVIYTVSTTTGNLSNAYGNDNIFRYAPGANLPSGQSITINLDSISANTGWTLNSTTVSNTVSVTSEAGKTARFSVNGGATFDFVAGGTGNSTRSFSNSQFTQFDAAGDTLSFQNVDQTNNGGMNLRNIAFTFDVTAVPEPSMAGIFATLALLSCSRRRRAC